MALRDEILGIKDCGEKVVTVPQWNGVKVLVKAFTAGTRYDLITQCSTVSDGEAEVNGKKLMIHTVIETAHDPKTGAKLFTVADYEALLAKNPGAIELLATTANQLSGTGADSVEDAEKN